MRGKKHTSGPQAGFSLIETLLGLMLIGIGLLFSFAFLLQHGQAVNRMRAHEAALQALDSYLEDLRGGAQADLLLGLPVTIDGGESSDGSESSSNLPTIQLVSEIVPASTNGLLRVRLTANYAVAGRLYKRQVESLLWRPVP